MILMGKPKDTENYVFVSFEEGKKLHMSGIIPMYKDIKNNGLWFRKEDIKER